MVLEAPGWAGRLCAPREMVVQRMLKTEGGMHVVLFSSVESQVGGLTGLTAGKGGMHMVPFSSVDKEGG